MDERSTYAATLLNMNMHGESSTTTPPGRLKIIKMWKNIKYPKEFSDIYEANKSGAIRYIKTHENAHIYTNSGGYEILYVGPSKEQNQFKVHRIIAATFIGDITDKEVHHIDGDRSNNSVKNLEILSRKEHRSKHRTTKCSHVKHNDHKKGKPILTEKDVRKICELLSEGYSYPRIREKLHLYDVSDDCIGKIASKKIWTSIASEYDIKINKRECMNLYSNDALIIAMLVHLNYNTYQIGEKLGYKIETNKEYQRLFKASKRYHEKFINGEFGQFSDDEIHEEINKL